MGLIISLACRMNVDLHDENGVTGMREGARNVRQTARIKKRDQKNICGVTEKGLDGAEEHSVVHSLRTEERAAELGGN